MSASEEGRPRRVRRAVRSWVSALQQALGEPAVPVIVHVPWERARLPQDHPVVEACRLAVEGVVGEHLTALAVPGRASAVVRLGEMDGGGHGIRVHGLRLGCAAEDVASVVRELAGCDAPGDLAADQLPAVAGGLCRAALLGRLSALLGPEQTALLLDRAGMPQEDGRRRVVAEALRSVLDVGVPVEVGAGLRAVAEEGEPVRSAVEMAEELIELRRPRTLDLLMTRDTLRAVTTYDPRNTDLFVLFRSQLFADTGVLGPDFRLLADEAVPQGSVVLRMNAVSTWPRRLPSEQPLWGLAAVLDRELRRRVSWFVGADAVDALLTPLSWALPDTVESVRARYPRTWLTAVARALIDEEVSVRRVATLLDRLLDLHPDRVPRGAVRLAEAVVPAEASPGCAELPHPRDVVAAIRQAAREEATRLARDDAPLLVRRLSPAVEDILSSAVAAGTARPGGPEAERAAAEVRDWADQTPGTPLLVSDLAVRAWLREALRPEFPRLQVVALAELHPATTVVRVPASSPAG